MSPSEFTKKYYPYAKESEEKTGISAIAILAQGALESGWGEKAVGNALFGIKSRDPKEKRQLITTTEILKTKGAKFPEIISITPLPNGKYRYKVKDWFRAYDSPADSFIDHARFLIINPRYSKALQVKHDPVLFVKGIAAAGYATSPDYASTLVQIIAMIRGSLKLLNIA